MTNITGLHKLRARLWRIRNVHVNGVTRARKFVHSIIKNIIENYLIAAYTNHDAVKK